MNKVRLEENGMLSFICPGCDQTHAIRTTGDYKWEWNNDLNKPTISPSILTKSTRFTEEGRKQYKEWVESGCKNGRKEFDSKKIICHSFIREGKIEYLSDCTHHLAGTTIELPDWK